MATLRKGGEGSGSHTILGGSCATNLVLLVFGVARNLVLLVLMMVVPSGDDVCCCLLVWLMLCLAAVWFYSVKLASVGDVRVTGTDTLLPDGHWGQGFGHIIAWLTFRWTAELNSESQI